MRELKFRAYHKARREFDYSEYGSGGRWGDCVVDCPKDYEPIQQYTGLKDIKGNEVYEGDIIESPDWNPSRYQVGFDRGGFCFFNEGDMFYNDIKYVESSFTVIGNIYENPDLLTNN